MGPEMNLSHFQTRNTHVHSKSEIYVLYIYLGKFQCTQYEQRR